LKNDGSFVLTSGDPVQKPFGKEGRQAHEEDDDDDDDGSFELHVRISSFVPIFAVFFPLVFPQRRSHP
jgi:hypothetical protein